MKKKGFFSMVLVLFFLILSLEASELQKNSSKHAMQTSKLLIEMEKANFIRAGLETDFDYLVGHAIEVWAKKSIDSKFLEGQISQEIAGFVLREEGISGQKFFFLKKSTNEKQGFSKDGIRDFFTINVKSAGNFYEADFSFHGGIKRDTTFGSEIELNNFSKKFFIAPGYNRKVLGISGG